MLDVKVRHNAARHTLPDKRPIAKAAMVVGRSGLGIV